MMEWKSIETLEGKEDFLGYDRIKNRVYHCWRILGRDGKWKICVYQEKQNYEITHWMPMPPTDSIDKEKDKILHSEFGSSFPELPKGKDG